MGYLWKRYAQKGPGPIEKYKMAASRRDSKASLFQKYNRLTSEIAELEVINSELKTLRPNKSVYNKQGTIFFMADQQQTTSKYKNILAKKMKERGEIDKKWKEAENSQ